MTAQAATLTGAEPTLERESVGEEIYRLVAELYPICRSITGEGFRKTLARLSREIPVETHEVPTGTKVFDWTVPREWNIRDAYVKNARGERVIDFQRHTLHVLNYSIPVHREMTLEELRPHLFTLPERPDWIPYRTSYYQPNWGFCLSHRRLLEMEEGEYEVCIDSTLEDGHLTYGEVCLPGEIAEEVLISCHACHPSLCNDNLSGVAVAAFLARQLAAMPRRYSYRFLFVPGTIGSITWLALNREHTNLIRHGLVLTGIGDGGNFTYKKSRRGNAVIDRAVEHVLRHSGGAYAVQEFSPYGYDERQYCSPGFNLPVGCLMRTPHGCYPQYHTSADNLDFVHPASLAESLRTCLAVVHVLENDRRYVNLNPYCEPQLGKRGLYSAIGGNNVKQLELAMLWALNSSDGQASLLEIAEKSQMEFSVLAQAARLLSEHGLLKEAAA